MLKLSGKEVVRIREGILVARTHISVCCARADLRLTYLHIYAALLLPPELLYSVGKCGFCCQAAVGCLLSWELFEEPTHMTRQCCLLCWGSLATFPFTTGTWCYGFSYQTLEVILVRVQGSWMWPRALTAAKRKEVAYHQDTVYAVQSDKLQLWSTVLLASIYLAETS